MNYANEFSYVVMARISTMGYAARNYRIFLPIVNCGGKLGREVEMHS
jgi:hypothetical protein